MLNLTTFAVLGTLLLITLALVHLFSADSGRRSRALRLLRLLLRR
ncbi:hypothetical protein [Nonomuraea terrae]|nr:hypothetical protein [Nonomuraea terrae]